MHSGYTKNVLKNVEVGLMREKRCKYIKKLKMSTLDKTSKQFKQAQPKNWITNYTNVCYYVFFK